MDSKVIAALIGLIGISLGALLAGIGYFLKTRHERLRAKKLVLFHLLEIRHLLKSSYADPKEITSEYITFCKSFFLKIGLSENEEIPDELKSLIENHMSSLIKTLSPQISVEFINSFENSLQSLCKDDPVLAFQLRGKEQLTKVLTVQENYIKNFNNSGLFIPLEQNNEFMSKELNNMNNKATEELIKDMDKEISLVSKHCGIITWYKCRSIIKEKSKSKVCFKDSGIEELLEQAFNGFLEATKEYSKQQSNIK